MMMPNVVASVHVVLLQELIFTSQTTHSRKKDCEAGPADPKPNEARLPTEHSPICEAAPNCLQNHI